MHRFRRPPRPQPAPNPAETLTPADIAVKTLHGLSTAEWLGMTPEQRADARNGVAAAQTERNAA